MLGLHAWLLPNEGQVMSRNMLEALVAQAPNVHWCWGERVDDVEPGRITLDDGDSLSFELAVDVRGVNRANDHIACSVPPSRGHLQRTSQTGSALERDEGMPVRGVRVEVVWLRARGVKLQRPVRLLHPRHRVYIVPRPGDLCIVGASEIESEERSPVSPRSSVD